MFASKKDNSAARRNIEKLWRALNSKPLFKKYFGNGDNDSVSNKAVKLAVSAGWPHALADACVYYKDNPYTLKRFQQVMERFIDFARGKFKHVEYAALNTGKLREFFLGDMSVYLETLESLLADFDQQEEEKLAAAAEAPPKAPLGQIAFSPDRLEKGVPKTEPNTKKEDDLYMSLGRHVNDNEPLPKEDTNLIKSLMNKELYPSLFKEPTDLMAYRGMSVSADWLRKALKLKKGEKIPERGREDASFVFTPRKGNASSWSSSKGSAKKFTGSGQYDVVLIASVEDNEKSFLDLNGGLYNLTDLRFYKKEREIVGMGKIRVMRVEWRYVGDY